MKNKIVHVICVFPLVIIVILVNAIWGRKRNLWLFGAWRGQKYSDNTRRMFEYIVQNESSIMAVWVTRKEEVYTELQRKHLPVVRYSSARAWCYMLRAGACFGVLSAVTDVFGNRGWLGYGIKAFYLTHGMPLKYSGYDEPKKKHEKELLTRDNAILLRLYFLFFPQKNPKNLYTCATSDFFVPLLHSATLIPESHTFITGTPRLDVLYQPKMYNEEWLHTLINKFKGAKIILYLPTFRDSYDGGSHFRPFEQFGFNANKFAQILEEGNYIFLNKGHYWDGMLAEQSPSERFINVVETASSDTCELMKYADILMTDYSSVYYDFLPLQRPIILTPFDLNDFQIERRKMYFDYMTELRDIKAFNWDDVCAILKSKNYSRPSDEQIKKYHKFNDGGSAKRLTNAIKKIV